jgi:hypothetical protein
MSQHENVQKEYLVPVHDLPDTWDLSFQFLNTDLFFFPLQDKKKKRLKEMFLYSVTAKQYPRKTSISNFKETFKGNSRDL